MLNDAVTRNVCNVTEVVSSEINFAMTNCHRLISNYY